MWTVLTGAITRAAAGTFLGRDLEIGESYRYGLARFWSIVLVGVLSALAIVGGFILLIIPGFIVLTSPRVRDPGARDRGQARAARRCAAPGISFEGSAGTSSGRSSSPACSPVS